MQLIYKKIIYLQKYCQKDINTKNTLIEKYANLEINAKDNRNNFQVFTQGINKEEKLMLFINFYALY